jgi:hypothetical protein
LRELMERALRLSKEVVGKSTVEVGVLQAGPSKLEDNLLTNADKSFILKSARFK